jgi:hypothetical protein
MAGSGHKTTSRIFSPISALASLTLVLLAVALALIVWLPFPEARGADVLSRVMVGPFQWEKASLEFAVTDLNNEIVKAGESRFRIHLPTGVHSSWPLSVNLSEKVSAAECSEYISELCGLERYSRSDGIVIDHERREYRSWRRKFRDWLLRDENRHFGGRMPRH